MLFSALSRGSFEGPVAGSDVTVVPQDNGTREDMEGVLLDPLVVVALVELVTLGGVSEQAGTLTNLRSDGVVEAAIAARAELVEAGAFELLKDGWAVLDRGADRSDCTTGRRRRRSGSRNRTFESAELSSIAAGTVATSESGPAIATSKA